MHTTYKQSKLCLHSYISCCWNTSASSNTRNIILARFIQELKEVLLGILVDILDTLVISWWVVLYLKWTATIFFFLKMMCQLCHALVTRCRRNQNNCGIHNQYAFKNFIFTFSIHWWIGCWVSNRSSLVTSRKHAWKDETWDRDE